MANKDPVEVVPYDPSCAAEWDAFVEASNNGTVFHKMSFLDYHPAGRFDFHHLLFRRGGRLLAVLPGGVQGDAFKSPVGATFGSFVTPVQFGLADADAVVRAFLEHCHRCGLKEAFFTPPMTIYERVLDQSVEYMMLYHGFRYLSHLYSSVVDLTAIDGDPLATLRRDERENIRRSKKKGVVVAEDTDLDAFYPILAENKRKYHTKPVHTLDELKDLTARMPESFKLFLARVDGEVSAGVLLFLANSRTVLNFYTAHLYEKREYRSGVHVLYESLKWARDNGYRYYDYGVSMDTAAQDIMEPHWSLVHFKEGINARGCLRGTLYKRVM